MKRFFFLFFASLIAFSCSNKDTAKVELFIDGAADSTQVVLSRLNLNHFVDVDTFWVKSNKIKCNVACSKDSPDFFYFFVDDDYVASLILSPSDKVSVKTNLQGEVSSIEGSDESLLFTEQEKNFRNTLRKMDSLAFSLNQAKDNKNDIEAKRLNSEIAQLYVAQKRASIKYIYKNAKSITIIPELYRKVTETLPVFGEYRDALIFKMAYDSLRQVYPRSPYILSLADESSRREKEFELNLKLENAEYVNYPEITLSDVDGNIKNLSDNDGNVIVLLFWTILNPEQKMFNLELKDIYAKYHNRGFEIYQISCDPDKTAWARTIKDQNLNWINVHDGMGTSSQYLSLYNVKKLPSMFIIDKGGVLTEKRDIFDAKKLDSLIGSMVK